jgi:hypothetical protein
MNRYTVLIALSFLTAVTAASVIAEDEQHYNTVARRAVELGDETKLETTKIAAASTPSAAAKSPANSNANGSPKPGSSAPSPGNASDSSGGDSTQNADSEGVAPPTNTHPFYSAALEQAVKQYRTSPDAASYGQLLEALKSILVGAGGLRVSPAVLLKDNPYIVDYKPKVIDTNGVRVWSFPKAPDHSRVLVQWSDVKQTIVGVGRRKHVVTSSSARFQQVTLTAPMLTRDAGIVSSKESGRHLVLAGDADDGSLSVQAFKLGENGWAPSPEFLGQMPAFLSNNLAGRISFRGSDLMYNVGKMIQTTDSNGVKRFLPEAESATYKFWLKSTDSGYAAVAAVPDEDAFSCVYQFMQAVQQSRIDVEKSLLVDDRLTSLPRYLGLQGSPLESGVRIVEMSLPPGKGQRFRLINLGKDDLIFDVGKVKNQWQVKSIFIAPPDPFLLDTSKYFPLYSSFAQKSEAKANDSGAAPTGSAAAAKRR